MIGKQFGNVFVTVGTTQFEELIETVASPALLQCLEKLGCQKLTLQIGRGKTPIVDSVARGRIDVKCYDLRSSIRDDIVGADLVISHAGAGTCIEVLEAGKPLVVVVNETLMDNHQTELAERLSQDGCLFYCTPGKLLETLQTVDFGQLQPIKPGSVDKFIAHLDHFMGFR